MPKNLKKLYSNWRESKNKYSYFLLGFFVITVILAVGSIYNRPSAVQINVQANQTNDNNKSTGASKSVSNLTEESKDNQAFLELKQIAEGGATPKVNSSNNDLPTETGLEKNQSNQPGADPKNIAQSSGNGQVLSAGTSGTSSGVPGNVEYASGLAISIADAISLLIGGASSTSLQTTANDDPNAPRQVSAMEALTNLTGELYYNKPVSAEVWAQDLRQRMNPVVSVSAQETSPTYYPGQGYNLLQPVRELWRTSANIVYVFYILIIIGVAFLIVFRSQLDGQNEVTLFSAIPSIIISLILVYFSYPLTALFIDFITIGSGAVYGVLVGEPGGTAPGAFLHEKGLKYDPGLFPPSISDSDGRFDPTTFEAQTGLQIDDRFTSIWSVMFSANAVPNIDTAGYLIPQQAPFSEILTSILNAFSQSGLAGGILLLVFTFAAFSAQLKLFFALAKEYVILSVYVIAAPFFFLFAAIPGQTGNMIGSYFRRLAAASLTFIAVYAIFLVIIIIGNSTGGIGDPAWIPPLLGYSPAQLPEGQTVNNIVRPLIAFFLFLSTPLIPEFVQALLAQQGEDQLGANFVSAMREGGRNLLGTVFGIDQAVRGPQGLDVLPKQRG